MFILSYISSVLTTFSTKRKDSTIKYRKHYFKNKIMPRDAGDIERNVDDLGKELREELDGEEDKKVSVHSMVKAWNKMAEKGFTVSKQVTEGRVLSVKKKAGGGSGGSKTAVGIRRTCVWIPLGVEVVILDGSFVEIRRLWRRNHRRQGGWGRCRRWGREARIHGRDRAPRRRSV